MKKLVCLFTLLFSAVHSPLFAAGELNYNIVNLQAEAARQIDNDIMVVIMSGQAEANTVAEASEELNTMMNRAAETIRKTEDVTSRTLNYQTRPLYKNKALIGWSATQQIRLESKEFTALSGLVGRLQEQLRVESMQFEVSPGRQNEAEKALLSDALAAFQAKAALVSTTLAARDYRIVNISVRENRPPAPYRRSYQAEALAVQSSSAPHVEAGESRIIVGAEGSIQLLY